MAVRNKFLGDSVTDGIFLECKAGSSEYAKKKSIEQGQTLETIPKTPFSLVIRIHSFFKNSFKMI